MLNRRTRARNRVSTVCVALLLGGPIVLPGGPGVLRAEPDGDELSELEGFTEEERAEAAKLEKELGAKAAVEELKKSALGEADPRAAIQRLRLLSILDRAVSIESHLALLKRVGSRPATPPRSPLELSLQEAKRKSLTARVLNTLWNLGGSAGLVHHYGSMPEAARDRVPALVCGGDSDASLRQSLSQKILAAAARPGLTARRKVALGLGLCELMEFETGIRLILEAAEPDDPRKYDPDYPALDDASLRKQYRGDVLKAFVQATGSAPLTRFDSHAGLLKYWRDWLKQHPLSPKSYFDQLVLTAATDPRFWSPAINRSVVMQGYCTRRLASLSTLLEDAFGELDEDAWNAIQFQGLSRGRRKQLSDYWAQNRKRYRWDADTFRYEKD